MSAVLRLLQSGLQVVLVGALIAPAFAQSEPAGYELNMGLNLSFVKAKGLW